MGQTTRNTLLKARQDEERKRAERGERREGSGMNWDGIGPNFQLIPPPLFLLNTEKFTFFPHKSA